MGMLDTGLVKEEIERKIRGLQAFWKAASERGTEVIKRWVNERLVAVLRHKVSEFVK